jgi:hypothetical protein
MSSGPPSATASARLFTRSTRNNPGVVRLNPKRASSLKVRQREKGRLTSCVKSARLAITASPSQGSASEVCRHRRSMSAMPPPTVSNSTTMASTTALTRPKRTLAIV